MIVSVFSDMISFLVIILMCNFVFSELSIIQHRMSGNDRQTFSIAFFEQYTYMLGAVPMVTEPTMKKVLYYVFSLFTVIVNLNLLIAIISETYANVIASMNATDAKGKADALSEIGGFKKYFIPFKEEEESNK